jgi:hypothetical protein
MPPRREDASLATLPHALLQHILARLPLDQRLRCAEVCRGWRAALQERSLWAELDFSPTSGVAHAVTDALLRAAAARAAGCLRLLDVTECKAITHEALLGVVAANGGALRELRTCLVSAEWIAAPFADAVAALLRAAPHLLRYDADVKCAGVAQALSVLRNEPPFGVLRVQRLAVYTYIVDGEAGMHALAAAMAAYGSLSRFRLYDGALGAPAAAHALVDACLARRLTHVWFIDCSLTPAAAPALARLLGGGACTHLAINASDPIQMLDEPAAEVLGDALRACSTIEELTLAGRRSLWGDVAAATVLNAVVGHGSLRRLRISLNSEAGHAPAAGAAIGALVAANAAALATLDISHCAWGDADLSPLVDVLAHNTHLRVLHCCGSHLTEPFMRNRLLPAVRANTSLRELTGLTWDSARAAEDAVRSRTAR